MKQSPKTIISLIILSAIYLLLIIRLIPGQPGATLAETLSHLLTAAPLTIGATLIIVSLLQKQSGQKVPHIQSLRLYLTLGVMLEIIFGLYDYLSKHQ